MVRTLHLGGERVTNPNDAKDTEKTYFVPFVPLW